jgi:glycosyltransferase involved in cell wall biosynthesis
MGLKKKILLIGMTSTSGGLERYIINFFSGVDQNIYSVDFLNQEPDKHIAYEKQIKEQGGTIVSAIKREKHFFRHYYELMRVFKKKYDVVYYNTLDLTNIDFLLFAKIFNRNTVKIVHAHNSQGAEGIRLLLMKVHQKFITKISDKRYACSKLSGDWMFEGKDYKVINNAIDLDKFCFDPDRKRDMIKQLGLDGKIVWGTVGRLSEQKNPLFLVEIMKYAHEMNPNIVFLHIGKGELRDDMILKIKSYHLENNYFLLGERKNVEDYYQIMEKFVFPSIYEGFGFSALEAQAMGIQTFITDGKHLTNEVDIHAGCMTYISLKKTAKEWADEIIHIQAIPDCKRNEYGKFAREAGFDLKDNRISL